MLGRPFRAETPQRTVRGALLCTSAILLVIEFGCGPDVDPGPPRFDVSGTVTFKGEPLPAGTITFTPNTEKGNKGPMGIASIENGHYDTSTGKGTVGGPHVVSIEGYDGKSTDTKPSGDPIFTPHTEEVDLPKEPTTKDFDIPESAAENFVPPKPEDEP